MQGYPTLQEVVLGALLHDIGKFAQRTGNRQYRSTYEDLLCPYQKNGNYFSHVHSLYTDGFLNAHKNIFPREINNSFVINTAAKHHKPDTPFEWIVTMADWLSSGTDRMRKGSDEQAERYYNQPLKSIFSKVHIADREGPSDRFYELGKLSVESAFPKEKVELGHGQYEKLWLDFENDLKVLQSKDYPIEEFFTLLDNILLHYTWAIPSSTMDEPDISLYDHLVTTAALAAALYRFHEHENSLQDVDQIKNKELKKFLFVTGDLSGIQDYIFHSSETKAKILRAKSFEIQAFSQAVVRHVLKKLELPMVCKIMDAGGRFLLLLPNTEPTKQTLKQLRLEVEEWAAQKYFGQLTLNLSEGVVASGYDLLQENARQLFANIAEDTALAKQSKLQTYLNKHGHLLENEYEKITGNQDVCKCCGKRVRAPQEEYCSLCSSQTRFGENIPKSSYLAWIDDTQDGALNLYRKMSLKSCSDLKDLPEYALPISINRFDPRFATVYTPYYLPMRDNGRQVMEFEEIAGKAKGKHYLAMLKADVDNLGYIFSNGMGNRISVSRYTSLSRMLNFFFSACINQRLKTAFPNLYMVFSGGDDLCLIGPWNEVLDFVDDLQTEFTRYTGTNPSITLSCGVALAGPKLPVHNMAEQADAAEKEAKENKPGNIYVFRTTANRQEYKELVASANQLSDFMCREGKEKVTSGVVYRLLDYGRRKRKFEAGDIYKENALWRSQLKYDTARNIKDESIRSSFQQIALNSMDKIELIASYALFKNRSED